MKIFEAEDATKALRMVRELCDESAGVFHKTVFLVYAEGSEQLWVTDDSDEVETKVRQDFFDYGCDGSGESHAENYRVFKYMPAARVEQLVITRKKARRSLLRTIDPYMRVEVKPEPEYDVTFNIGY